MTRKVKHLLYNSGKKVEMDAMRSRKEGQLVEKVPMDE